MKGARVVSVALVVFKRVSVHLHLEGRGGTCGGGTTHVFWKGGGVKVPSRPSPGLGTIPARGRLRYALSGASHPRVHGLTGCGDVGK